MLTQDGIATAGRCFLLGLVIASLSTPLHAQQGQLADIQKIVVRQRQLYGIAIRGKEIYLADIKAIHAGDIYPDGRIGPRRIVTAGLPDGGQHPNRTEIFATGLRNSLAFGWHPGTGRMYAFDNGIHLPDGFNRQALLKAMQGNVLAKGELVGAFQAPQ